jgi:hypothetical protein
MASKKRSPSAERSAGATPTTKCLYCDETKTLDRFNREHVIPEAFGKYEENLVLRACVCWDCNDHFGRTLDLALARDSKEGLDRFVHGLVEPKPGRTVGTKIALRQRGGAFHGAILDWELDSKGTLLKAKPARQVGFARTELGPFEWHRVEALPSIETLRSKGVAYCVAGGLAADEAAEVFSKLGLEVTEPAVLGDPRDGEGMLDTTMEGKIDQTVRRAVAKIAFNYFAFAYPTLAPMDQFRDVRRYIRWCEDPGENPVSVSARSILGGLPPSQQIVAHIVATRWDGGAHQVIAQVSLFNWVQYRVVLSTSRFLIVPTCIDSGHMFNPYAKQIALLTRDRRRAAMVPLMTKEEFRAQQVQEAATDAPPVHAKSRREPGQAGHR